MRIAIGLGVSMLAAAVSAAQPPGPPPPGPPPRPPDAVKVLVDCLDTYCDQDFIRSEITFVDHVRTRQDADVHVLVTTRSTGSGGYEYTVKFSGRAFFQGRDEELVFSTAQTDSDEQRRRALVQTLKLGLVRYVSHSPLGRELEIGRRMRPGPGGGVRPEGNLSGRDPWNYWVFRTSLNGELSGEQSQRSSEISGSFSANRTTDRWKINLSASGSYSTSEFTFEDGGTFESTTRRYGFDALIVKSLSDRWSAGLVSSVISSTFYNQDLVARLAPAIEYNVFPYKESTRRQLTVRYEIGVNENRYTVETIFGRTAERLADQKLIVAADIKQPWGSLSATVEGSHYLPDWSRRHVIANINTDVRLFKGFSFNVWASTSRIHDQVYLPRGSASEQEVLVRQRQLATSYSYSMWVGVSYSFGSIFNNVVNTRLSSRQQMGWFH